MFTRLLNYIFDLDFATFFGLVGIWFVVSFSIFYLFKDDPTATSNNIQIQLLQSKVDDLSARIYFLEIDIRKDSE